MSIFNNLKNSIVYGNATSFFTNMTFQRYVWLTVIVSAIFIVIEIFDKIVGLGVICLWIGLFAALAKKIIKS